MKEKFKYLIPLIIIATLVFPKPVFAMIGTGIFDYFETALGGIEELSGPVTKFIFSIFLYYVVGLGVLFLSSYLLQFVLGNLSWLSVTNNTMVLSGWSFVAGITNMFFILIFVFIALATILKIETLAAKKLLPKLLIVALLVNFSLIFVGVTIDISNIFYSTIIGGDTSFIPDIFSVLTKGGEDTLLMIITLVLTLLITFIIPFTSPFAQMGLVILIVATGFIGNLLIWFIQAMMFFMMSGILLTYVFLFAARIFILQLLAMVAPLAFLCSVLPQTKKYWDDWLKMVVEWNTFGVVTLLFLVVGLRGINALLPPGASAGITFSGATLFWGALPGYFTYYFFLFVYLVALLHFSQKYSPQLAGALIVQAKAMGGMIYAKGLKPFGRAAKPAVQKVAQWAGKKTGGRLQGWGEKRRSTGYEKLKALETKKGVGGWLRRRGRKFQMAVATKGEQIGRRITVGAEESATRTIEGAKSKTKGKGKERQSFELQNAIANKDRDRTLGVAEAMMEDKNLSEAEAKGIFGKEEYKRIVKTSKERGRKDIARYNLASAAPIMEPEKWKKAEKLNEEAERLKEAGKENEAKKVKEEADKLRRETMGELFDKVIDPNKMDQVSDDSFKNKFFVKAFVDRAKGSHASQTSIHKSRGTLDRIQAEINRRGVIQTIKDNPTFGKWLGTNTATKAGLGLPQKLNKDDEEYIKEQYKGEIGGMTAQKFYEEKTKKVTKGAVPIIRKTAGGKEKTKEETEKEEELIKIKNDPQKLFNTYYAKETPNRVKEYIKDYLSGEEITLPPETMVKMMGKKKEILKEKLKKEAGEEKGEEILNKATIAWKKDLSEGKGGLGLTSKYISDAKEEIRKKEKKEAEELRKATPLERPAPPKKPSWTKANLAEWQGLWKETPIPPAKGELEKEVGKKEMPKWVNQSITLAKKSQNKLSGDIGSLTSLNKETLELILERDSLEKRLKEFSDDARVPSTGEIEKINVRKEQVQGEIERKSTRGEEIIERIKARRTKLNKRIANISSWREEAKIPSKKEGDAETLIGDLKEIKSKMPLGKSVLEQVEKYSERIDKETKASEEAYDEIKTLEQKVKSLKERREEIGIEDEGKWKAKKGTGIPFVQKRVHELTRKIKELEPEIGRRKEKKRKVDSGLSATKEELENIKKDVYSWKEEQEKKKPSVFPISPEEIKEKAKEIITKAQEKASLRGTPIPNYIKAKKMAEKELDREAEKLLTSDLGGALKFIPSEIKKPVKEGRKLQFKLKRDLEELKKLKENRERLEIRESLIDSDLKADRSGGYDRQTRGAKETNQKEIKKALKEFKTGGKMQEKEEYLNKEIIKSKKQLRESVKTYKEWASRKIQEGKSIPRKEKEEREEVWRKEQKKEFRKLEIDKLKKRIKTKWEEVLKQKEGKEFRKIIDRTIKELEEEMAEKLQEETGKEQEKTRKEIYEELKPLFDKLNLSKERKDKMRKMWGNFPKEE